MQGDLFGLPECHTLHGIGAVKTNDHFTLDSQVWEGGSEMGLKDKHASLKGGKGTTWELLTTAPALVSLEWHHLLHRQITEFQPHPTPHYKMVVL